LFSKVDTPKENIHFVCDFDKDEYMKIVREKGGIDIAMLGIGMDGHLGFNEPPNYSNFDGRMQEVKLRPETIENNIDMYPEILDNPYAITMGMADIMESKKLFFLANKVKKAEIVKQALKGPITEDIPASILQKHPNVEVILDEEAGSML
jgi:glucosamine-6-phosphate deaminase